MNYTDAYHIFKLATQWTVVIQKLNTLMGHADCKKSGKDLMMKRNKEKNPSPSAVKKMCSAPTPSTSSTVNPTEEDEASGSTYGPEDWKKMMDRLASYAAARPLDWSWKAVVELSKSMGEAWIRTKAGTMPGTVFSQRVKQDHLSCQKCGGVLHHAVTLYCGSSFCRKCASSDTLPCCRFHLDLGDIKGDVTVAGLVEKWWSGELKAVDLRNKGNAAFAKEQYQEALDDYSASLQSNSEDFTLLSNRSHLFVKMNRFEEALKDADQVVRIRPDWPKGHFRRYVALKGLGRHEEALIALFYCAAMERTLLPEISEDIAKLLYAIISSSVKKESTSIPITDQLRTVPSGLPVVASGYHSSGESGDSVSSVEDVLDPQASGASMLILRDPARHVMNPLPSTEESEGSDCDKGLRHSPEQMMALSLNPHHHQYRNESLDRLVDHIVDQLDRFSKSELKATLRTVDLKKVDAQDFECTLCCRMLWQPVTTPCGHSFCRSCLDRCFDHNPACPLCKTSLGEFLAGKKLGLNLFLDHTMSVYLPQQYEERTRIHEEEMRHMVSTDNIPIFICTMAYPSVPCPLHVFEPRYRLMIRRCMEMGSRQFGMCASAQDQELGFAEYGTMLEVREVKFFADGRSVVDTRGGRRFKVLRRGMMDGYCTASVEFLKDQPVEAGERTEALTALHSRVHNLAFDWVDRSAPLPLRQRILQHYGTMPIIENDWIALPNGPAWLWWLMALLPLDTKAQVAILSMTRLEKRLEAVERGVIHVRERTRT